MTVALLHVPETYGAARDSLAVNETLIESLRRGDPDAVGSAYDQHHEKIRAFARRLTGDEAAAEDIVHEVFVSLPSAITRYRGDASLSTFLLSIAVNHARHHVRAATRRRKAMERFALEPGERGRSPEDDSMRKQAIEALQRAMDALPFDQRITFVLCEVEERSAAEAAEVLRIPEATVRTRIFHARRKLREMLNADGVR